MGIISCSTLLEQLKDKDEELSSGKPRARDAVTWVCLPKCQVNSRETDRHIGEQKLVEQLLIPFFKNIEEDISI